MSENMTYVPSRLTSAKTNKVVAGANEILDDDINLKQDVINTLSKKVIDLNSVPTSSTLTYTVNSVICDFKVGDEVRVADQESETGYTFYKLYALTTEGSVTTATWDKVGAGNEGGSAAGLKIVEASGTTLNAEVGRYYRYDSDVTTLTVNLPTITGATEVKEIEIVFRTGISPSFQLLSTSNIIIFGGLDIAEYCFVELKAKWNGNDWIIIHNISTSGGVDLGLPSGIIWSEHNVGAKTKEDYGLYFSWGNVNGSHKGDSSPFSQSYYANTKGAQLISSIPNTTEYDAARKYLGGTWRIPTSSEWAELVANCNISDSSVNGVAGLLFTSKINGNTMFIPFGGYNAGSSAGSWFNHWSSTISQTQGYAIGIEYRGSGSINTTYSIDRFFGFNIRPVRN